MGMAQCRWETKEWVRQGLGQGLLGVWRGSKYPETGLRHFLVLQNQNHRHSHSRYCRMTTTKAKQTENIPPCNASCKAKAQAKVCRDFKAYSARVTLFRQNE